MNAAIEALPPLREVIRAHDLAARKQLGQHFLLDLNLTRRIARAAAPLNDGTVIEVGPGPGGLTRALLLEGAGRVVAVERDRRCIEALQPLVEAAEGRLELIEADARGMDPARLGPRPLRIVANLPYNVGTALLLDWLDQAPALDRMILMFQREVGDRIVASPGSDDYGRLAVAANWRCETRRLFDLPARAFTPPPKVDSTVVQLVPYARPLHPAEPEAMRQVTAAAFGQRRKMLRSALRTLVREPEPLLLEAGIDPTARAETLTIADFARLANVFSARRGAA